MAYVQIMQVYRPLSLMQLQAQELKQLNIDNYKC